MTLDEILNLGLEEADTPLSTPADSPCHSSKKLNQIERLTAWLEKHGGRTTVREIVARRVAGVKNAAEARRLLRALAARGRGRFVVERSGRTRQRKEAFVLLQEGRG